MLLPLFDSFCRLFLSLKCVHFEIRSCCLWNEPAGLHGYCVSYFRSPVNEPLKWKLFTFISILFGNLPKNLVFKIICYSFYICRVRVRGRIQKGIETVHFESKFCHLRFKCWCLGSKILRLFPYTGRGFQAVLLLRWPNHALIFLSVLFVWNKPRYFKPGPKKLMRYWRETAAT